MKPFLESVKIKVFLGYFTLIILASLIIWVIYSEILQNSGEKVDFNPVNNKFIYINNIVTNLYQAEGLERSYAQTGQKIHYQYYLKLMDTISLQIDTLALMVNNPTQQMHTDSIKKLLQVKKQNLKELDAIKKRNSSTVRYEKAIEKLSSVKDSIDEPLKVYKNIITDRDSVYLKQKKKKFFERLVNVFAAQNKTDSNLHVRTIQKVQIDSLVGTVNPADTIAGFLLAIMTEIRDENLAVETRLKQKEREILANDLTITFQLREMLSNIEKEELNNSFQEVQAQQNRLVRATWMIILVGSFALVTIIIFLVNILKDITKSQHYRQSLEKAKAYSESLLKSKEQFMLSLTHDLKSPLSSIIGFAGLMERDDGVSSRNQKYLQNINKASGYILKLINNLLDLARLDTGKMSIERLPFNLKPLIDDIVEGFRPQAQAKNINLQLQSDVLPSSFYISDPVRITQIVSNLISNALKFTEDGNVTVKVSVVGSFGKADRIRIDVIDTGIGISEENIQLIFEEFARVTTTKKQYEGTGLGLTITQKIIKLLQGTINLESKTGEGSRFTIVLPLEKSAQLPNNTPIIINEKSRSEKVNIAGKKVWIIDDDETLLDMTSIVLKSAGMEVHSFSDPLKAIQSFTKGCADLLITDIQMPVINGVELLKQIQEKNGGKITSIAISGMNAVQNDFAGFSAFIQKPFHPQTLIDVISGQQQGITVIDNQKTSLNARQNRYNLEQFAAFASRDPESLRQILVSLIHSGMANTALFRQYLQDENLDALSALSHKMLTLFRQMEATDIVELLSRLEQKDELTDNKQYFLWGRLALEKIETILHTIQIDENISID
ncbi:MAG TPA: hybrid sensor histidine kinase/response regulator [Prolixibacteraceae bacterium]